MTHTQVTCTIQVDFYYKFYKFIVQGDWACQLYNAQNPFDTFPRNFPVDGEVANLLPTL